ncbi:hypothetical protein FIU15_13785 [Staphylococcus aureus]|nr:hypothetical protein FIU15_13785 [Staphylococcus aureus]
MSRHAMTLKSLNYRVDLESEYTNHLFPDHPSAVIAMERYYFQEGNTTTKADALCFTFIPLNVIDTFQVKTQSERQMKTFVEETVYASAYQSDLKYSITKAPMFKIINTCLKGPCVLARCGVHLWQSCQPIL